MFGWGYKTCDSTSEGGILGHLQAWTGAAELTGCANFHGHFLIWLLGGLNLSKIIVGWQSMMILKSPSLQFLGQ